MPSPWNHWYHVMCHTYGNWLPGDPRGFRTRHHRQHVDGDYKNPPPKGKYDSLFHRSQTLMTRVPVHLSPAQCSHATQEFAASFQKWNIPLHILSIDSVHLHALIRVPDHNPRHYLGLAKKESSAYMKRAHLSPQGGLWAARCKCLPITDASHFAATTAYIRNHAKSGAIILEPQPQ